jgi:hypothetical protein
LIRNATFDVRQAIGIENNDAIGGRYREMRTTEIKCETLSTLLYIVALDDFGATRSSNICRIIRAIVGNHEYFGAIWKHLCKPEQRLSYS